MRLLQLDDEETDLLMAAAAMSQAAMDARSARIDPDGLISKSARMSAFKLAGVQRQLSLPPLPDFCDLPMKQRAMVLKFCGLMVQDEWKENRDAIWQKLRLIVLSRDWALPPVISHQEAK